MAISVHSIPDYKTKLLELLRRLEGFEKIPYYDRAPKNTASEYQNVTIGDGINIDWSNDVALKLVLTQLGLVESSTLQERARRVAEGWPMETDAERMARLNSMVSAFKKVMRKRDTDKIIK